MVISEIQIPLNGMKMKLSKEKQLVKAFTVFKV